jgi:hypothetical protein
VAAAAADVGPRHSHGGEAGLRRPRRGRAQEARGRRHAAAGGDGGRDRRAGAELQRTHSGDKSLQDRIREASGRDVPASTIDDFIRALGLTDKVVELVNPLRDPVASAQVRQDVRSYPLMCIVNLDATHIEADDYIQKRGRAARGQPAQLHANRLQQGGATTYRARTLYAAMNIFGMVTSACKVIDGNIDNDVFMDWVYADLVPSLRRYDPVNPRRNSVLLLDNATFHHQDAFLELMDTLGVKVIFLTPYDPGCAPIERANHQVRHSVTASLVRGCGPCWCLQRTRCPQMNALFC